MRTLREFLFITTEGTNARAVIRQALENKNNFFIDVYFNNRSCPNIISGRYKSIKSAEQATYNYIAKDVIPCGNI